MPGIGIDLETAEELPAEIVPLVCTEVELNQLANLPPGHSSTKITFSSKESAYKVLYPLRRRFWDFLDADMEFNVALESFHLELGGAPILGRYRVAEENVISVAQATAIMPPIGSGYDPHLVVEDGGPTASTMN